MKKFSIVLFIALFVPCALVAGQPSLSSPLIAEAVQKRAVIHPCKKSDTLIVHHQSSPDTLKTICESRMNSNQESYLQADQAGVPRLHMAVFHNDHDTAENLLVHGEDTNKKYMGFPAREWAQDSAMVKLLVKYGHKDESERAKGMFAFSPIILHKMPQLVEKPDLYAKIISASKVNE